MPNQSRQSFVTRHTVQDAPLAHRLIMAPNPAVGPASAWVTLTEAAPAKILAFDITGTQVLDRGLGVLARGEHRIELGALGLPRGVYLFVLLTDEGYGWKDRSRFKLAVVN